MIIGVTARGKKRFLAIEDGARESTQSWREVLLKLKERGMNPPKLAIGPSRACFAYPAGRWMARWGFGLRWMKFIRRRVNNAAGSTKR